MSRPSFRSCCCQTHRGHHAFLCWPGNLQGPVPLPPMHRRTHESSRVTAGLSTTAAGRTRQKPRTICRGARRARGLSRTITHASRCQNRRSSHTRHPPHAKPARQADETCAGISTFRQSSTLASQPVRYPRRTAAAVSHGPACGHRRCEDRTQPVSAQAAWTPRDRAAVLVRAAPRCGVAMCCSSPRCERHTPRAHWRRRHRTPQCQRPHRRALMWFRALYVSRQAASRTCFGRFMRRSRLSVPSSGSAAPGRKHAACVLPRHQ